VCERRINGGESSREPPDRKFHLEIYSAPFGLMPGTAALPVGYISEVQLFSFTDNLYDSCDVENNVIDLTVDDVHFVCLTAFSAWL